MAGPAMAAALPLTLRSKTRTMMQRCSAQRPDPRTRDGTRTAPEVRRRTQPRGGGARQPSLELLSPVPGRGEGRETTNDLFTLMIASVAGFRDVVIFNYVICLLNH